MRLTARSKTLVAMLASLLSGAPAVVGCGPEEDTKRAGIPPVASAQPFPEPNGRTIEQIRSAVGPVGPLLAPSAAPLRAGMDRFRFGIFGRAHMQIAGAAVALYVAPPGGKAIGPFAAHYEEPKPRAQRRSTPSPTVEPSYVASLKFERPGPYEVLGLVRLHYRLVPAMPDGPPLEVKQPGRWPPSSRHRRLPGKQPRSGGPAGVGKARQASGGRPREA